MIVRRRITGQIGITNYFPTGGRRARPFCQVLVAMGELGPVAGARHNVADEDFDAGLPMLYPKRRSIRPNLSASEKRDPVQGLQILSSRRRLLGLLRSVGTIMLIFA